MNSSNGQDRPEHVDLSDMLSRPTRDIVKQAGGCHEGHFVFHDGYHGNGYVSKMTFLRHPRIVEEMGDRLARLLSGSWSSIDTVVGPPKVGAILAYAVARRLNVPFTIVYRSKAGPTKFHRDFAPEKGTSCLIVDDLAYSGSSLSNYVAFMASQGLKVIGAAVICSRVDREIAAGLNIRSLMRSPFERHEPTACPLCHQGIEIMDTNIKE